jgi:hypothetical protein
MAVTARPVSALPKPSTISRKGVAQVRQQSQVQAVRDLGAHKVVVDEQGDAVAKEGLLSLATSLKAQPLSGRGLRPTLFARRTGLGLRMPTGLRVPTAPRGKHTVDTFRELEISLVTFDD